MKKSNPYPISDLFAKYEIAKRLKELKFNEPCLGVIYPNGEVMTGSPEWVKIMLKKDFQCVAAPLKEQVVLWLMKQNIFVCASQAPIYGESFGISYSRNVVGSGYEPQFNVTNYHEALDIAIKKGLDLCRLD